MNIIIDFSQIPIKKVGVGIYALRTFEILFKKDSSNNYIAIVQNDDPELKCFQQPNVTIIKINAKIFRKFIFRIIIEQIYIPYLILRYKVKLVHSLHYSFPLLRFNAKRVITIHDMTFFIFPNLHTTIKRYYFRYFIALGVRTQNTLICVSQSTANDLLRYFPKMNSTIKVVPLAMEKIPQNLTFDIVKKKYQLPESYILFIGTLEPRKNIERLIEAFNLISNKIDEKLVIVGKKGWFYDTIFKKVKSLELKEKIIFTGFVSEEEKFSLLKGCKIFIYPSIYEGFGLPVLEAMSAGIPTITSNISSMPEVTENAALLINPLNTSQIAETMFNLIKNNRLQYELKHRALLQSSKFSWAKTANKTLESYL